MKPVTSPRPQGRRLVRPGRRSLTRRAAVVVTALFGAVAVVGAATTVAVLTSSTAPAAPSDPDAVYGVVGSPVPLGSGAADVEAGAGFLWVSNADDGTLSRVDPATGATITIRVGGQPGQIVVGEGAVWVRNLGDRITRVDLLSGAVSPPIPGGGGPITGMAVGGGSVWLSHRQADVVSRIDARTLAPVGGPIRVATAPGVMEYADGAVFVVGSEGDLIRLDAATGERTGTSNVGPDTGGVQVDGDTVYVAADGGVVPAAAATLTPGSAFRFDSFSYFEVNDGVMWVIDDQDPGVQRVDASTRQPIGRRVDGLGDEVGRARFAFGRLWMTIPDRNQLVAIGPL